MDYYGFMTVADTISALRDQISLREEVLDNKRDELSNANDRIESLRDELDDVRDNLGHADRLVESLRETAAEQGRMITDQARLIASLRRYQIPETNPGVFRDVDGDRWYRCPNGLYSLDSYQEEGSWTVQRLANSFGPITAVRNAPVR